MKTKTVQERLDLEMSKQYLGVVRRKIMDGGEPMLAARISALESELEIVLRKASANA